MEPITKIFTAEGIARMRDIIATGMDTEDASWFSDNCSLLLDGWRHALDEIGRLKASAIAVAAMAQKSSEVPDGGFPDADQHLRHYVMCMGRIRYLLDEAGVTTFEEVP